MTSEGSIRLRNTLMLAKEIAGRKVDLILSSPIARARESAEIAGEVFGQPRLEIQESLEPQSPPYEVYRSLSRYGQLERVILVSHQPLVSHMLAGLLNWNDRYFSFKTGGVAMIEVKEMGANPEGVLLALLPSHA